MTVKECYAILEVPEGAGLDVVKRSYRRLAFALHPDLNPGLKGAARRFRLLNEAYVTLNQALTEASAQGTEKATTEKQPPKKETPKKEAPHKKADAGKERATNDKAREEARKAYEKASAGKDDAASFKRRASDRGDTQEQQEVLNDILQDPFARRVFEDIYSHIRQEKEKAQSKANEPQFTDTGKPQERKPNNHTAAPVSGGLPSAVSKLKSWARNQIDDEQVLRLPGSQITPGARVRLQIQHGISGETQTIEVKLPPNFTPGMTMRLKGLGKRVCGWAGDLYVRIESL